MINFAVFVELFLKYSLKSYAKCCLSATYSTESMENDTQSIRFRQVLFPSCGLCLPSSLLLRSGISCMHFLYIIGFLCGFFQTADGRTADARIGRFC